MKKRLLIHPEELTRKKIDIFKGIGLDILSLHPVSTSQTPAHESLERLLKLFEDKQFLELLDYAKACGMEIEYEMHAASYLVPRHLFGEHPEYFRMNEEGERVCDQNFCVTNAEALSICVENALRLAKKLYRSSHTYYIWLDDVAGKGCHCEKCRKLSPAEQNLTVMNAMIRRLREEIPDATLACIAYLDTKEVPKGMCAEDGIFLEYAPIDRDMEKGAAEMPEEEQKKVRALLEFFGTQNASVLEYWYDNSFLSRWKKPPKKFVPDNTQIQKDILFYASLGFSHIGSFACFLGDEYEVLWGEVDYSAFR